ncbi:MAG: hypothetical protein HQ591_00605 [candidate division Zixibacteria bacterium]|nr:hypothetical protein [Candidatus Tariuqbacter arcticus]
MIILAAAQAASYPLSIFTTVILFAHEFNIPNSAAIPSNNAPYPAYVGAASS